jgi:hypothetical protein
VTFLYCCRDPGDRNLPRPEADPLIDDLLLVKLDGKRHWGTPVLRQVMHLIVSLPISFEVKIQSTRGGQKVGQKMGK